MLILEHSLQRNRKGGKEEHDREGCTWFDVEERTATADPSE